MIVEFFKYSNVILMGFVVWLWIAPRVSSPRYGELFLAYMVALMFSLVASSEIMMVKPIAFFFTVGGVLAFCYVAVSMSIKVTLKK